ncbi:uncharacterized protein LOC116254951 isoform X2 [Nymphaea colorata]|uniref:uncharacterized protein LOC116254951 isoform X2 n=1 Tax=Nymphaea colorata TaxID=210225 RepID=UPI00129DA2D4|nr:uncharacterized protein LOC116254951 isoform X2 [Nymphaea colorata]
MSPFFLPSSSTSPSSLQSPNCAGPRIATLMKHLPISGPFGVLELKKIAERFEERMHATSMSQPDYLRRISIKMLQMEPISACNFVTGGEFLQVPGQGNPQNTSSVSQTQNQARLYGDTASLQQHQQQPKKQKRSCSHVMGKQKKCRMSSAVEEEILCSICLDPVMDNGERSTAKLRCSHQFHLDCIGSAFNAKASMQCPTCRRVENGQWRFGR